MSVERLLELEQQFADFKAQNLNLDMTRGKPSPKQLDLSLPMLSLIDADNVVNTEAGDLRNYGGLDGIPQAKKLFSEFMQVTPDELIIGGNASLPLMYNALFLAMYFGTSESAKPWKDEPKVKFICPVPGYDRHFSICEHLGVEMITVPMTNTGPDMDQVEALVAADSAIKGMWCVPKYSNPDGVTYSDDCVERLASMKTAAKDFRLFWDNAYTVHFLGDAPAPLADILDACKRHDHAQRVYLFGSTSKISFAGAGLAFTAGDVANIAYFKKHLSNQIIGPDKINQLRHVLFFKNMDGIIAHMENHASILKPKFDAVLKELDSAFGNINIASWKKPEGGYFISLDGQPGTAKATIAKAGELGVKLTPAGSPFPYGKDPQDNNIRIAPSFPRIEDVQMATKVLCACLEWVTLKNKAA